MAQLAAESGISESAIRNWSKRRSAPLERVSGGVQMHTWGQLFAFMDANPTLYKAAALRQLHATRPSAPAAGGSGARSRIQVAAVRAAAEAHVTAIVEAVKAAEATARLHREQLETLMSAFDDAVEPPLAGSTTPRRTTRRRS